VSQGTQGNLRCTALAAYSRSKHGGCADFEAIAMSVFDLNKWWVRPIQRH
jgi:hypothetical protein